MVDDNDFRTLQAQHEVALSLIDLGQLDEARAVIDRALPSLRTIAGTDHPQTTAMENSLAGVLMKRGEFAAAVELLEQLFERSNGESRGRQPGNDCLRIELGWWPDASR